MLFSHKNNMFGFPAEGVRRKRKAGSWNIPKLEDSLGCFLSQNMMSQKTPGPGTGTEAGASDLSGTLVPVLVTLPAPWCRCQ